MINFMLLVCIQSLEHPTARAQISQILAIKAETKLVRTRPSSAITGGVHPPRHEERLYLEARRQPENNCRQWRRNWVWSPTQQHLPNWRADCLGKMYSRLLAQIWKPSLKCIQTFGWPTVALRFAHVTTFNQMRHKMPQSTKPLASSLIP